MKLAYWNLRLFVKWLTGFLHLNGVVGMIEYCHDCGIKQPIVWWSSDEIWNWLVPEGGCVCPNCFDKRADNHHTLLMWRPEIEINFRRFERSTMNTTQVASICYETNRSYAACIGDHSFKPWNDAPLWQKETNIDGVEFHLANLRAGREPSPSASHENWLKKKQADGWKYGPVEDVEKKEHPCFMPYDGLPIEQRMKDYLFSAVVQAFFRAEETVDNQPQAQVA